MSNPRWVIDPRAKGGRLLVETLEPTPRQKKQAAKGFGKVPLQQAAKLAKAADMPGAMVLVVLFYLAWKHNGAPFSFSNMMLAQLGINRWAKYRLLAVWEDAGLIKVDRRGKRAPIVTLLAV